MGNPHLARVELRRDELEIEFQDQVQELSRSTGRGLRTKADGYGDPQLPGFKVF